MQRGGRRSGLGVGQGVPAAFCPRADHGRGRRQRAGAAVEEDLGGRQGDARVHQPTLDRWPLLGEVRQARTGSGRPGLRRRDSDGRLHGRVPGRLSVPRDAGPGARQLLPAQRFVDVRHALRIHLQLLPILRPQLPVGRGLHHRLQRLDRSSPVLEFSALQRAGHDDRRAPEDAAADGEERLPAVDRRDGLVIAARQHSPHGHGRVR
mmetsp:Transcript_71532/g.184465  ORF Transcript_71532/g.184465 Transcript_71532/m.184465 type:complete len:207 (-) Transcript_71532:947-1567(-)